MTKKLDTFNLRDKFGGTPAEIREAAVAAAKRRSEFAGWEFHEVRASSKAPFTDGEFTCYPFEIYGVETAGQQIGEDASKTPSTSENRGVAAQEPNP